MARKYAAALALVAVLASVNVAYAKKFADDPEPERHYTNMFGGTSNADSGPADVKTVANPLAVRVGGHGADRANSAVILVQANRRASGRTMPKIGDSVGDGSQPIQLPKDFEFSTPAAGLPAGACPLTPTEFRNMDDGTYTIRVTPDPTNASCAWVAGIYSYVVHVRDNGDVAGSDVGTLVIR